MTVVPVSARQRHAPRHAAPSFPRLRKATHVVSVRIPKHVNAALDAVGRRPLLALSTAVLVFSVSAFAARPDLSLLAVCMGASYAVGSVRRRGQVGRLAAEVEVLQRENGRQAEQLRHVARGDASATTARMFTIPEAGEPR